MKYLVSIIFLCLLSFSSFSQNKKWTLQDCIDHAIEYNISLKQKKLQTKKIESKLKQTKLERFPNFNASSSLNTSYGRSLNIDNTYVNVDNQSASFGVSSSVDIFRGFQKSNTIKKGKVNLLAQQEDIKKAKEDITLGVVLYYLEILFSREQLKISQEQIDITKQQLERTKALISLGKLPKRDLIDLEAKLASEQAQLVEAENKLTISYLNLKQYIDLEDQPDFEIVTPNIPIGNLAPAEDETREVYHSSLTHKPEIKALKYALESSEIGRSISAAQRFPSLSLNLGWNTNHYDNFKASFSEQLKNNASKYWALSLSIPIFNQGAVAYNVELSKINIEEAKLNLENQQNVLFKKIKEAYTNLSAALKKYHSNELALEANQKALVDAEEKFKLGVINSFEFLQAKNQYTTAKINLSRAKYEYIFQQKIVDFYKGLPIIL